MLILVFDDVLTGIVNGWKQENELQQIDECSMYCFEDNDLNPQKVTFLIYLKLHLPALVDAVVSGLENRVHFDLAVTYHQHSGGRRCYLRDLQFEILDDLLQQ
ncbi:E4 ORF3 [Titi monkey adenovirus ECC-2011]|uniref:E4 ORF3 n=1 Tax=titi monkey adenovirus 1 TaxID=3123084 RepID=G0ZAK2_9ADEN|nr:E4 ORF3 [Titi monkey adenovirus ECC-2011]AEK98473.1 E4 ORF3 [Titi monkey adenovirus ECC-2011]